MASKKSARRAVHILVTKRTMCIITLRRTLCALARATFPLCIFGRKAFENAIAISFDVLLSAVVALGCRRPRPPCGVGDRVPGLTPRHYRAAQISLCRPKRALGTQLVRIQSLRSSDLRPQARTARHRPSRFRPTERPGSPSRYRREKKTCRLLSRHTNVAYAPNMTCTTGEARMAKMVWSKPWYRSRGIWGAIIGAAGTGHGLWAGILPCGAWQTFHNYSAAALTLYGAYLAFVGRRTASQPIHIFWRRQVELPE
jgi:hypothetical protein